MRRRKITLFVLTAIVVAAAGTWWLNNRRNQIEISSFDDSFAIFLAKADSLDQNKAKWFEVKPGKNSLSKGSYFFQLRSKERTKSGLIAIRDSNKIVLK